jgi:ribonuclease P protein component
MLPKKQRLNRSRDIMAVIKRGSLLRTPHVNIYYRLRDDDQVSRSACIVGKKVHRSAVKRHTYQRWLRSAARQLMSRTNSPVDTVWVAQSQINHLPNATVLYDKLEPHLSRLFRDA